MRIGIGLGVFPVLGITLGLLRIPLDWRIFLLLSIIIPSYSLFKVFKNKKLTVPNLKLTKYNLVILLLFVIFFVFLFTFNKGAFNYPWLEDDDSWHHALGTKFVAVEKTIFPKNDRFMYIDPYPPNYDLLMGVMHQTNNSVYWTLKFFNVLIISLGLLFFFFFVKEFTGNKNKALFSTFILFSIPCYLSHFIWAHSLVVTLFFPAMYCVEMLKKDKKWIYPSIIAISGIPLTQPSQSVKLFIMLGIYFLVKMITQRKFVLNYVYALAGGYALSLFWWATKWKGMFGVKTAAQTAQSAVTTASGSKIASLLAKIMKNFRPDRGTATRAYTFNDFFVAKHQNMINNPVGVGVVICLLVVISLIYVLLKYKSMLKQGTDYRLITLIWLIFTFLGVNSMTFNLPVGLFAFRFWMLFAIPVAIICSEGLWFLMGIFKKFGVSKVIVAVLVILGVLFTSAHQKQSVNTATWPPGLGWASYQEVEGYNWLRQNLPVDTPVFTFTENMFVIGYDMYSCEWCEGNKEYRETAINRSGTDLNKWLKTNNYEYLVIDGRTVRKFGVDKVNEKLLELTASNAFRPVYNDMGLVVLQII